MVGTWRTSPVGALDDLMWARSDGRRVLVAGTEEGAAYVSGVYGFDEVVVGPLRVSLEGDRFLHLRAPELGVELHLTGGVGIALPWARPAWFTRWVEAPVARRLLGVRVYGVSPSGVREWYRAVSFRRVVAGWASIAGRDLGRLGPIDPAAGFGFSEPPRFPTMVGVEPLLEWPVIPRRQGRGRG
ncbi:MAG: hypothetical protein M3326_11905 [Actinomycetota bacterium]|nr:hypothetical protein [Actinomycetota bacterium]